ncbi:MAG TPA: hypothetical protein VNZ06_06715, partial [Steroidobacteraceae bacterium]|nr:hypothetical protein [Steroidobacteraceae bacterium]
QGAPGVHQGPDGEPIVSAEVLVPLRVREYSKDAGAEVSVRGIAPRAFLLRPEIKIIAGRVMQPGVHELLVGRGASSQFKGLRLGEQPSIHGVPWTVVGIFESNGDTHESELLAGCRNALIRDSS